MKRFLLALSFLTIFPAKSDPAVRENDYGASLFYFPFVGLLIGMVLAAVAFIFSPLPAAVRSSVILLVSVVVTGALHLDGFADTCDGFYGRHPRGRVLEIMRDSHIGTMAAIGLVILLLTKFSLIASLEDGLLAKALVLSAVFSRWAQGLACVSGVYARNEGKGRYFVEYARKKDIFFGGLFSLFLFIVLIQVKGLILFFSLLAAILVFLRCSSGRIGGVTGDTIGAASEIAEALTLFAVMVSTCVAK